MSEQDADESITVAAVPPSSPLPSAAEAQTDDTSSPQSPPMPPAFDPSRMIGIIKRKSLINELAAVYHQECLAHCLELLELQKKSEEPFIDVKTPLDLRKETMRPSKRVKKTG